MITSRQKHHLRALSHKLGTIIWIGQKGLTDNVSAEIEAALDHHELIKVRIRTGDKTDRDRLLATICENTGAELVMCTGTIACLYRRNDDDPVIRFPA